MGKCKKMVKGNVVSTRVSDEEKAVMKKISRCTRKSLSKMLREAIHHYCLSRDPASKSG